jgi:hypothetical protein
MINVEVGGAGWIRGIFPPTDQGKPLYKRGEGCLTLHTPSLGATSLHLSTPHSLAHVSSRISRGARLEPPRKACLLGRKDLGYG